MNINEIKPNPSNPRIIKDDKFKKLVKSIQDFPQMLELRPIVIDENNIVLGGNMRLKAAYLREIAMNARRAGLIKDGLKTNTEPAMVSWEDAWDEF